MAIFSSFFLYHTGFLLGTSSLVGPSQIDLESDKSVTVCTSQRKSLACSSPGSSIAVTDVFWGRKSKEICPSDDGDENVDCNGSKETPGIVRGMCEGKAACQLEAKHKLLQNPSTRHCLGVNKYLMVSYTCVPDAKEVTVCDGEQTKLKCPASFKTYINSVFWGRQSTTVCPADNGIAMCTGASESLELMKKKCDGSKDCEITASYKDVQDGAENCPGIQKYLIVNYSCKPAGTKANDDNDDDDGDAESGEKTTTDNSSQANGIKGEKVELTNNESNRLGTGGLKALEKVNTLIKQSDGGQLTDDQEKAIERMIIGGLEEGQKKNVDVQGSTRADIPKSGHAKSGGEMNKQIVELAKLVDEATSKINYKKAAVARPRPKHPSSNEQSIIETITAGKPSKRVNVPRPLAAKRGERPSLNKYNTRPVQRGTIPKRPMMPKTPFIYGKIMPGNRP